MKKRWKDTTNYARGEVTGKTVPRSWSLGDDHDSKICVHRHIFDLNTWFLTCYALKIEQADLKTDDLEKAKELALSVAAERLRKINKLYQSLGVVI